MELTGSCAVTPDCHQELSGSCPGVVWELSGNFPLSSGVVLELSWSCPGVVL